MNFRIRLCVVAYLVLFGLCIWLSTELATLSPAGEMMTSVIVSSPE